MSEKKGRISSLGERPGRWVGRPTIAADADLNVAIDSAAGSYKKLRKNIMNKIRMAQDKGSVLTIVIADEHTAPMNLLTMRMAEDIAGKLATDALAIVVTKEKHDLPHNTQNTNFLRIRPYTVFSATLAKDEPQALDIFTAVKTRIDQGKKR